MNQHPTGYTEQEVRDLPLSAAKTDLLEEVLASSYDERPATVTPISAARHRRTFRLVLAGVAATAVVAAGASVVLNRPDDVRIAGPGDDVTSSGHPSGTSSVQSAGDLRLAAMAKRMPRFLLDAPGWQITTVYGFGRTEGTLGFSHGTGPDRQNLQLEWYPADQYGDYFHDRNDDPSIGHEATTLAGGDATLFTYSATDHATMLQPDGDSFVELRGMGMSRADYLAITAQLRQATVSEFLAALPADVTTPGDQGTNAQKVLADIPVPPGFTFKPDGETLDPYQFGALVTGQVACAWIDRYRTGTAVQRQEAVTALETSHSWKVLNSMNADGDWPEAIWEYADGLAHGDLRSRAEYRGAIGCTQ